MMAQTLLLPDLDPRLYALNEVLRMHPQVRARTKRDLEEYIGWRIKLARLQPYETAVWINYLWVMPDARRDKSNVVAGGRKVIEDALGPQTKRNPHGCGILRGDGWNDILGWQDTFEIDPDSPRVVVTIMEADEWQKEKCRK